MRRHSPQRRGLAASAVEEGGKNLTAYRRTAWDEDASVAVVRGTIAHKERSLWRFRVIFADRDMDGALGREIIEDAIFVASEEQEQSGLARAARVVVDDGDIGKLDRQVLRRRGEG
jgi:hypothetical protein